MSIFGGTMSRAAYAWVALPTVFLSYFGGRYVAEFVPLVFARLFAVTLANIGIWMAGFFAVLYLLVIVLAIVSAKRLRDIGATGWLALPLLLRQVLAFIVGLQQSQAVLHGATTVPAAEPVVIWLFRGLYVYGLVLVLVLLIVPGRRKPAAPAETAAAF
jgi:uncharacterized membrane protein YhaH (DUF805 family)